MAEPGRIGQQVNVFLTPTHLARLARLERRRNARGQRTDRARGERIPRVEIVRRALLLLEVVLDAEESGASVVILEPDGTTTPLDYHP